MGWDGACLLIGKAMRVVPKHGTMRSRSSSDTPGRSVCVPVTNSAEYQTSGIWFAAIGVQAGGMIASASQSTGAEALREGIHFKESGYFLAPQVGVGRRIGRFDVRLVAKPVWHFGAEGLDAFDSVYAGISLARISR